MNSLPALISELFSYFHSQTNFEHGCTAALKRIGECFGFSGSLLKIANHTPPIFWIKEERFTHYTKFYSSQSELIKSLLNLLYTHHHMFSTTITFFPDLALDFHHPLHDFYKDFGIRSMFGKIIKSQENILGFLCFFHHEPISLSDETTEAINTLTEIIQDQIIHQTTINQMHNERQRLDRIWQYLPTNIFFCRSNGEIIQHHVQSYLTENITSDSVPHLSVFLPKDIYDFIDKQIPLIENRKKGLLKDHFYCESLKLTFDIIILALPNEEIAIILNNISEQKEIERCNTDFICLVSHELRTPLTTMLLAADLIQEGGSPTELNNHWQILKTELEREKSLVEKLLLVGRLERGDLKLRFASIDVGKEIRKSIQAIQPLATTKNIKIKASLSKKLPIIQADPLGINQIFINLLNNAVKYSYDNSTVSIIAKPHTLRNQDNANDILGIRITIKDQGIGIPEEDLPNLFQRYFRAQNAKKEDISGSGIGLYVVKSIIDEHKGTINFQSKLNEGTIVTVWLPCNQNP